MTANIEQMAFVGQTPWHGLGNKLTPDADLDTWRVEAGLDWSVEQSPVFYRVGNEAKMTTERQVFYRSDRPDVVLNVASDEYRPVQPAEVLAFLGKVQEELDVQIHTAGVLGDGAKYWALAKTGETTTICDQDGPTEGYLLIATANDGSMSTRIGPTRVRVVCQNTLTMALSSGEMIRRINHRSKVDWNKMRGWVAQEHRGFELYGEIMRELHKVPVSTEQAADFSRRLLAPEWDGKAPTPRKLNRFVDTLAHGVGQREAGETAYGLINAVTRYADHDKQARSQETRLDSAWFGAGANLKIAAMDQLINDCVKKWGHGELVPVLRETRWSNVA